jgi:hypothetical protein
MTVQFPSDEAKKEALTVPNGWVYELDGNFSKDDAVPPQNIKGAWKVDEKGIIVGSFIPNPNYKDEKSS